MAFTALSAAGITYWVDVNRVPQFRSMARLLITPNPLLFEGRDLLASLETLERTSIQATYEEVLNSSRIRTAAKSTVVFAESNPDDFEVEALALPSADLLEITAEGPSPRATAELANSVVQQGLTYLTDRYPMYTIEVLDDAVPPSEPFAPNVPRDVALALVVGAGLGLAMALWFSRSLVAAMYGDGADAPPKPRQIDVVPGEEDWFEPPGVEHIQR